jgi:hypothetical protein
MQRMKDVCVRVQSRVDSGGMIWSPGPSMRDRLDEGC